MYRIIPAYAGSTGTTWSPMNPTTDHPRIRGEHLWPAFPNPSTIGSSPHTRGAPRAPRHSRLGARIIPAYAGSTSCRSPAPPSRADHPRIRGEHGHPDTRLISLLGSSPHTRGAPAGARLRPAPGRIIPAYAGSTVVPLPGATLAADHPRIRGEHHLHARSGLPGDGSSPHTRGALRNHQPDAHAGGIIPAYAGSTEVRGRRVRAVADHPRIRGEHANPSGDASAVVGSSPHTRGARDRHDDKPATRRIIPAYAGSTPTRRRPLGCRRDHPRIRGEHGDNADYMMKSRGSSPHTRGAHEIGWKARGWDRIIPAYAGSTTSTIW